MQASTGGVSLPGNWQRAGRAAQMRGPGGTTTESQQNLKRKVGTAAADGESKGGTRGAKASKKRKIKERIVPQQVIQLVPESQAYMDLIAFENKLDSTIMRKRLDIQEALKRPVKQKRTLRFCISSSYCQPKVDETGKEAFPAISEWELKVEGSLIDDVPNKEALQKPRRKFSSFFKNLIIELDKDLYGPANHLVEWHRTATTQETDGFQVKRPLIGRAESKCDIFFMINYQPAQFKLSGPLSRVLGIHTQTRAVIVGALWHYIKRNKLQDEEEREYVNNDKYLKDIFNIDRMKFCEIPQRLQGHLLPPEPIVIHYTVDPAKMEEKKPACYDISIELDDSLRDMMQSFLLSTNSQQEIASLDARIHETVDGINQLKLQRDFFSAFSNNPLKFMNDWLTSQSVDLKMMTGASGNPEEERNSDFYNQTWAEEAVHRYFYRQVQIKRAELEQALGLRSV